MLLRLCIYNEESEELNGIVSIGENLQVSCYLVIIMVLRQLRKF